MSPPTGARVFAGSGCLSKFGLNAKMKIIVKQIMSYLLCMELYIRPSSRNLQIFNTHHAMCRFSR